jgi:hypothetical protein
MLIIVLVGSNVRPDDAHTVGLKIDSINRGKYNLKANTYVDL